MSAQHSGNAAAWLRYYVHGDESEADVGWYYCAVHKRFEAAEHFRSGECGSQRRPKSLGEWYIVKRSGSLVWGPGGRQYNPHRPTSPVSVFDDVLVQEAKRSLG